MGLISLILVLAIVGVIVWAVITYVPMPAPFQRLILIIAVIACILYALSAFGLLAGIGASMPHVGNTR